MNSAIKLKKPETLLLAEVYVPSLYRDYLFLGKMDYLYDKVELYDILKGIIQGWKNTDEIPPVINGLSDIGGHMLQFLENHDEQRIASPEFAGDPVKAKPAMVVSATIRNSPVMIYFGQEVGEPANEHPGFGSPSRTSIFDYIGVPHHQRWMNYGAFDGGLLSDTEKNLREFYKRLLNFSLESEALTGEYREIHSFNRQNTEFYNHHVFSFVRYNSAEKLVIVSNFHNKDWFGFDLGIPPDLISEWGLQEKVYTLSDQLYGKKSVEMRVNQGTGRFRVDLQALESFIFKLMN
jgi:hypothetical protein